MVIVIAALIIGGVWGGSAFIAGTEHPKHVTHCDQQ